MAIKFQYNKTSQQLMEKQLKLREKSLPTIKNKESALRIEVKHAKQNLESIEKNLEKEFKTCESMMGLWNEFDATILSVTDIQVSPVKIAGVNILKLDDVLFELQPFSIFNAPAWYVEGILFLKEIVRMNLKKDIAALNLAQLELARKKTTQKVNLFEKVQIPGYKDAIQKIKRALEDENTISIASQKIVKMRQQQIKEEELS